MHVEDFVENKGSVSECEQKQTTKPTQDGPHAETRGTPPPALSPEERPLLDSSLWVSKRLSGLSADPSWRSP